MGCSTECMSEEFKPENIGLVHHDPSAFVTPQWHMKQSVYLTYRIIVAILIIIWVCADFVDESLEFYRDHLGTWFLFATNWGFVMLAVLNTEQAILTGYYYVKSRQKRESDDEGEHEMQTMTFGLMLHWMLHSIAANGALVITMSYWTFLSALDHSEYLITPMSRLKHSLNAVFIIVDLFISATPVRIFHLLYPLFFGAIYTVFNAIYFINDGIGPLGRPYVYYVMDWRNPISAAVTCALGFMLSTLMQIVLYELFRLRVWIYERTYGATPVDTAPLHRNSGSDAETGETESILRDLSPTYESTGDIELLNQGDGKTN